MKPFLGGHGFAVQIKRYIQLVIAHGMFDLVSLEGMHEAHVVESTRYSLQKPSGKPKIDPTNVPASTFPAGIKGCYWHDLALACLCKRVASITSMLTGVSVCAPCKPVRDVVWV